jgi:hypothetical protein
MILVGMRDSASALRVAITVSPCGMPFDAPVPQAFAGSARR